MVRFASYAWHTSTFALFFLVILAFMRVTNLDAWHAGVILALVGAMHFLLYMVADTEPRIIGWVGFLLMSVLAITVFDSLPEIVAQAAP